MAAPATPREVPPRTPTSEQTRARPEVAQPLPAPIDAALDVELARFELYTVRLWQFLASIGIFVGLLIAATAPGNVGWVIAGIATIYFLYTFPMGWRISHRGRLQGLLQVSADLVEGSVPWTFLVVTAWIQGAEYALASWTPPVLFCMVLFQNALRLRARAVFGAGIVGSCVFLALGLLTVTWRLPADADGVLFTVPFQVARFVLLVLVSIVCGFGARYLRAAIIRAEEVARSEDLFGKYRLLRTVASGGMGKVIEALYCPEGGFQRRVAIKRIHEHLASEARFVEQFRFEAELCSHLAHPNIVQVLDFGRIEETYFLAMEYVDGLTLAQLLARSDRRGAPLPEHVVGVIMWNVLDGLDHAHRVARGEDGEPLHVVHRDLCPQNILLSRNGEVKVSDFGVARALKDTASSATQNVVGHTAYLAPEQAQARDFDSRIDLFSAGVILWELLTGRRLFLRHTDAASVLAILHDPVPPVSTYRPGADPGWDALIQKALKRDPAARFQSAREMMVALDEIPRSSKEGARRELSRLVVALSEDPGPDDEAETRGATRTLVDEAEDLARVQS